MALKRSIKHNFPKSAKNTPKSDKRMNQMSIPPFWGVFCGVFGVHSQIWASEVPFFGTLKRALLAKVPIFKCQKMALRTAKSYNGLQKPCETPPKMVDQTFHSCVYHFWVGFKPILENCVFQTVLEPFSQPNGCVFSNHFPLMKTSTEIFQIFQAISKHKKAAKKHPSQALKKNCLMMTRSNHYLTIAKCTHLLRRPCFFQLI